MVGCCVQYIEEKKNRERKTALIAEAQTKSIGNVYLFNIFSSFFCIIMGHTTISKYISLANKFEVYLCYNFD